MIARLLTLFLVFPLYSFAQVSFPDFANGDMSAAHCDDYFREVWGTPLDMRDADHGPLFDIPAAQTRETTGYSYADGIMSTTATGASSQLMLLQYTPLDTINHVKGAIPVGTRYGQARPIDTNKYRYFVTRMFSDKDTIAQIIWSESNARYAVTTFPVYAGWHSYSIDLANAPITASSGANVGWAQDAWEGFELYPSNVANVSLKFDWIQLAAAGCGTQAINYSAAPQGANNRFALVLDNDQDPTNGVASRDNLPATGSGASAAVKRLLYPDAYNVYAIQSADWATLEFSAPFDMSSSSQIISTLVSPDIASPTFSAGRFSGTATGGDPNFYLKLPEGKSIPAATYNKISIGIQYTFPAGVTGNSLDFWYVPNNGAIQRLRVNTVAGYQVLNITPPASWNGNISAIRIDPSNDQAGISFSLDFISFNSSGFISSLDAPAIQLAAHKLIVPNLSLTFLQPDERGGRDYAQTVLGNAWLMDSSADIATVANVLSAEVLPHASLIDPKGINREGDFFRAYTITGNGDPQFPNILFPLTNRIDPATFVNVCFTGWNATESNSFNSVARFIWHDAAGATGNKSAFEDGDDIIIRRDNHEYCLDLRTGIPLEPPLPAGAPNPWTSIAAKGSSVDLVRVDLSESIEAGHFSVLDAITLRSDHEAHSKYAISVDAPLDTEVDLFYGSSSVGAGGSPIGVLAAGRSTNVLMWDTSAVGNGTYYVYGTAVRSGDSLTRVAPGRVIINHNLVQDVAPPVLECERPEQGSTFDTYFEIAGYAFDETRLAALDLFIDETYVRKIDRDKFHLAARTKYPNAADANTPGFQFTISGAAYRNGLHSVRLQATDTAGNKTSCDRTIRKVAGGDTPLLIYPASSNESVPFVVPTPSAVATATPRPQAAPQLKVSIKKDVVTAEVTGLGACTTFSIEGSSTQAFSSPVSFGSYPTATQRSVVLSAKKASSYAVRGKKSEINDGLVFLRASCNGVAGSSVKVDLKRVGSLSKARTEAAALAKLKKLLKVSATGRSHRL